MKCYLVGGAVRDELLALPVREKDWLVTGATPDDMIAGGYRPVGKDFPVFLHPETHEEYALARTEKKDGHGYGGFTFYTSPDITVEQDLLRRDLTINAIARDDSGRLIDPYGGVNDIKCRNLRHVSSAFTEDPLRILRVARFAAQFHGLGFSVSSETMSLMQEMVASGELDYLSGERIWQETLKALCSPWPDVFFAVLYKSTALHVLFPWLVTSYKNNDSASIDPARKALIQSAKDNQDAPVRFTCGFFPWNACAMEKILNKKDFMARVRQIKCPKGYSDLLSIVVTVIPSLLDLKSLTAQCLLRILEKMDAFRRKERFKQLLIICRYLLAAREPEQHQILILERAWSSCLKLDITLLIKEGLTGKTLADRIRECRLESVRAALMEADT